MKNKTKEAKAYDTKKGLQTNCRTLEGFHQAVQGRKLLRKQGTMLDEFIIGNNWFLDKWGFVYHFKDVCSISQLIEPRYLEFVISMEEMTETYGEQMRPKVEGIIDIGSQGKLPPIGSQCAGCGEEWAAEDGYDAIRHSQTEEYDLSPYEGKTVEEAQRLIAGDGASQISVLSVNQDTEIPPERLIRAGDKGLFTEKKHYHRRCLPNTSLRENKQKIRTACE